ncbi:MAG: hypothetical protein QF706_00705 [Roseibacillus sp.]|nr:hypothetical protein [Roseibacillus sp.]|tara:strand:+ start:2784 stop:3416 length:633 start_codon:yes stop_codon:yes gene_type:complete
MAEEDNKKPDTPEEAAAEEKPVVEEKPAVEESAAEEVKPVADAKEKSPPGYENRRPVVIVIAVILLLGLVGGGILGWMYMSRDRVGVLNYRVQVGEEVNMREVIAKEEKFLESDQVLKQVIKNLSLIEGWRMDSEEEVLAHMRAKLIVKEDRMGALVRVIYRDRKQDRALEILQEIKKVFTPIRSEAVRRNELPALMPMDDEGAPLPTSP